MTYLLLLVGFVLLIKGAEYFVDGASNIATLLRVPPMLIGLTIVAFGTSSPEATVSMMAALQNSSDVALGNVLGSNIFNLTFVIGIAAFIYPLKVETETIRKEIPFTLLASVVLLILMSDIRLQGITENLITRSDGFILLLFLSIFIYYVIEVARNNRNLSSEEAIPTDVKWSKSLIFTVAGLAAIIFGGNMVVNNSIKIAYQLGMSETLVGLTIIAIGTSLPELVTSAMAAVKKQSEMAIGNVVGSNIFNILFVGGASSIISPLVVNQSVFFDAAIMIGLTILLFIFSRTNYRVGKYEGLILIGAYVAYLIYIILRN